MQAGKGLFPPPPWWAGGFRRETAPLRSRWAAWVTWGGKMLQASSSSTRWRASGGQHPAHLAVLHQHHMLAVVGDVLGVVLNDDDGLAVVLVQVPQHLIDPVGVHGVQLGDGLVQDQDVRLEGHRAGQGQQVGLAAGELPDVFLLPALQTALPQAASCPRSR